MIGVVLVFVTLLVFAYFLLSRKPKIIGPGPPGLPIVGNLLQVDASKPHVTLTDWARKYGEAYVLRLGPDNWLVLNSYATIYDALVRNGEVFAGRPKIFRLWLVSRGYSDIFFADSSTEKWRTLRKCAHRSIRQYGDGMERLEGIVSEFIGELVTTFGDHKGAAFDPRVSVYNFSIKSLYYLVMGEKLDDGDKFATVRQFERDYIESLSVTGKGTELDTFPWLRYFGNATYKKLKRAIDTSDVFWDANFPAVRKQYNPKDLRCVVDSLIQLTEEHKEQKREDVVNERSIEFVFLDLIVAGIVTTSTSMTCLLNILLHHKEVMKRMQEEVDRAVGQSRPVVLSDRPNMPYTRATIYELLRYTSILPLNVPHATQVDTEVNGIFIPAGTNMAPNLWLLHHDEEFWDDPWKFRPERFLDAKGEVVAADHDNRKHLMPFGAGTRVCVGEVFALSRMFLAVASLLQRFSFLPEDEKKMTSCDPRTYELGIVLSPKCFKMKAVPRA